PATYDDARDGLRAVTGLAGVDLGRVVTCGHSAGGHLALWTAAEARRTTGSDRVVPVAAVALAGVVDVVGGADQQLGHGAVQRLMGGEPHALVDRYRDASLLDALPLGLPQVLVHGSADDVVPPAMAVAYAARARASGDAVEVLLIDGADHMSMIDPRSPAWSATVEQLARHLA
ncbi:MAG TPA: prolyl oligopeptidase family serine peptidase, partial [Acidimicrobiales bacterium]|nr:prolyl oligopeptidase family serine peptidase [Acidimicrobiales bacterium]